MNPDATQHTIHMSFWNNPENNSVKILVLVVIAACAGYFVSNLVHKNSDQNTARVIPSAQNVVATPTENASTLAFSETATGKTCTMTVANPSNPAQSITVVGTTATNGNGQKACVSSVAAQTNPAARGLVTAMAQ